MASRVILITAGSDVSGRYAGASGCRLHVAARRGQRLGLSVFTLGGQLPAGDEQDGPRWAEQVPGGGDGMNSGWGKQGFGRCERGSCMTLYVHMSGGVLAYGCLSGARCRLAYRPADATATHRLLLQ